MKNKKRISTLQKEYLKVPQKADKIGLSPAAMRLLIAILNCGEDFNPSLSYLERRTGMSRSTLSRAHKQLQDHGVIKLLKRGRGNRTAEYELAPPSFWRTVKVKNKDSVLRNKIMQKSKCLTTSKELAEKRAKCPVGKIINYIIPIIHPDVCGLNVPWNIQYLSREESLKKGASFDGTKDNDKWKR